MEDDAFAKLEYVGDVVRLLDRDGERRHEIHVGVVAEQSFVDVLVRGQRGIGDRDMWIQTHRRCVGRNVDNAPSLLSAGHTKWKRQREQDATEHPPH